MLRICLAVGLAGAVTIGSTAPAASEMVREAAGGTTLEELGVKRTNDRPLVLIQTGPEGHRIAHFFARGADTAHRSVVVRKAPAVEEAEPASPHVQRAAFRSPNSPPPVPGQSAYDGYINADAYRGEINRIAARHGVDPALVRAVMHTESSFNPHAVSHAGAVGLMQLMPATAERFQVKDRRDPVQSIEGGVRYLRFLLDTFDNIEHAIAGYNAGEGAVMRHGGIPPYRETQDYVPKVLARYQRYREAQR